MSRARRSPVKTKVDLETLEQRRLLTTFGEAWPNERELTISFPADGVAIGKEENELSSMLDQIASRQEWQELLLRAYQTWSIHSGFNVGLRNDYDLRFGTPGLTVGDPRFGEFRIGAFPQTGLVASSVPFQATAGTHAGDLLLNSNEQFTFHDWDQDLGPAPETIAPNERDLFSLFLHEAGNTLGIEDNYLPSSVMFAQYTVPKGVLTEEDIDSIQSLYGERDDPYESVDNGQVLSATVVETPNGFDPATSVLRLRGSLSAPADVDVYKVTPLIGCDTITLRVRTEGVSLLQSNLELVDAAGHVLESDVSESVFDNNVEITVDGLDERNEIYLRVSAADSDDIYSVGDYFVEVDYRDETSRAADLSPGSYQSGADALFTGFDLADFEVGSNDTLADATTLGMDHQNGGVAINEDRFEFVASTNSIDDVDVYKITAPSEAPGRLMVHVAGVGSDAPSLNLRVVDATGQPVGTSGVARANGTFTVEVAAPQASQEYFIQVSVDPNSNVGLGNYVAVAEFDQSAASMHQLTSGTVEADADRFVRWEASKTKLFRFALSADSPDASQGVRLTIYDAHTREIKLIVRAEASTTRMAMGWLQEGEYILQFTAIANEGASVQTVDYSLGIDGLSDDQDDDPYDGDDPGYDPYDYQYNESYNYSDMYSYSSSDYYYYTYYGGGSGYGG
ncbi:matrixin family metalloprotease [Roseiconus lacunae]|uniref:matrixin family metalloprotease n=1 Tax=Roseiconus lacunae TaxID=2605694 RepID=UPI001E4903CF|nr:matrixin family metalloprotease [Roseiconus lacunae]MCD0458035.1 matrixin family metalloprotease [Roseiconus lacunae]